VVQVQQQEGEKGSKVEERERTAASETTTTVLEEIKVL